MRAVCNVFSVSVPRTWRQIRLIPPERYCLRIVSDCPLDVRVTLSWQEVATPLSIARIGNMLIDWILGDHCLIENRRKFDATVALADRGQLKYAFCDIHRKGRFFRSWYIHNGTYMVYVNYSSKERGHEAGVAQAEKLVKSLRFLPSPILFPENS